MRQFKWAKIDRRYRMAREDWLFVAYMVMAGIIAFGLGLAIGTLWAYFL
jgi:hypothetical protein